MTHAKFEVGSLVKLIGANITAIVYEVMAM